MNLVGLALIVLAAILLVGLSTLYRKSLPKLRAIPALTRLYRAIGLSVEDGTRLLIGLGNTSLLTGNAGAPLAGLGLLRHLTERTSLTDYAGLARVAAATETPIALGENESTLYGFNEIVRQRAGDILQPSITKVGGISEFKKIAALAQAANLPIAPHSFYFGPGLAATLHVAATFGGPLPVEFPTGDQETPFLARPIAHGRYARNAGGIGPVGGKSPDMRFCRLAGHFSRRVGQGPCQWMLLRRVPGWENLMRPKDPTGVAGHLIRDHVNVRRNPPELVLKRDRVTYWIGRGAQPSETVKSYLKVTPEAKS